MSALVLIRSKMRAAALVALLLLGVSLLRRLAIEVASVYLVLACVAIAQGAPLDPNAFTSLGTLDVSSGTLTINTDTLAISGAASFTGVVMPQSGGPEIAVFTFGGIDIAAGATIAVSGTRPLALLSHGDITIVTTINLSGSNGGVRSGSTGGTGGLAGAAGGGAGGSGGNSNDAGQPGTGPGHGNGGQATAGAAGGGGSGAGFGGNGGAGYLGSPAGGSLYGDVINCLEGGSGGGGGGGIGFPSASAGGGNGGGGGGGAIEIGAVDSLALAEIITGGGSGIGATGRSGGGGSGGGMFLHGSAVSVTGQLSAAGGTGNSGQYGSGGGGGRVAIVGFPSYTLGATVVGVNVNGSGGINFGIAGVVTLGPNLTTIPSGHSLVLDGAPVVVTPGSTSANDPTIAVLVQRDLTVQSGGQATLGASDVLEPDSTLTVAGVGVFDAGNYNQTVGSLSGDGDVRIDGGGSLTVGFGDATSTFAGRINGAGSLRKTGAGSLELPGTSNYSGTTYVDQGTLALTNSLATLGGPIDIAGAGTLEASGIVQRLPTGTGSIAATGTLLIGNLSSTNGFEFGGSLQVGSHTVQLLDGDAAHVGGQTTLSAGGRLASLNGIVLEVGENLTAAGAAEVDGAFTNGGTVNGPTGGGQFLTFTDDVDGAGSYTGNVLFSDGFSPDNNLAAVSLENIAFDAGAELRIDLGGLLAGEKYDQLNMSGAAILGGALTVSLINGFTPDIGQTFTILTADDVDGMFTTEMLPSVPGRIFDIIYNPNSVVLTVSAAFTADFDEDGDVDAADLAQWEGDFGGPGSDADGDGDSDGRDVLVWLKQFGSGAQPLAASQAVPEPGTLLLIIFGIATTPSCARMNRERVSRKSIP